MAFRRIGFAVALVAVFALALPLTAGAQGPGTQITSGAVLTLRFENVCVPAHPLKL